jgi:hypothetical protein
MKTCEVSKAVPIGETVKDHVSSWANVFHTQYFSMSDTVSTGPNFEQDYARRLLVLEH